FMKEIPILHIHVIVNAVQRPGNHEMTIRRGGQRRDQARSSSTVDQMSERRGPARFVVLNGPDTHEGAERLTVLAQTDLTDGHLTTVIHKLTSKPDMKTPHVSPSLSSDPTCMYRGAAPGGSPVSSRWPHCDRPGPA